MEEFNEYMEDFKKNSLEDKKTIALEQLKLIASLTNKMCEELGIENDLIITKDVAEAEQSKSEDDFVEAVVVYASSIQNSLCDFADKATEILETKAKG